jgi:hypothetical protein
VVRFSWAQRDLILKGKRSGRFKIEMQPIVTLSVNMSSSLTYTFLPRNVTIRVVFIV